jgi:hypothetical protein
MGHDVGKKGEAHGSLAFLECGGEGVAMDMGGVEEMASAELVPEP